MGGSGEWIPLYVSIILIAITGGVIPLVINSFVEGSYTIDNPTISVQGVESVVSFLANGICTPTEWYLIGNSCINIFFWLPDFIIEYIGFNLAAYTQVSSYVGIPLLILTLLGFLWGLVKVWEAIIPG